MNDQKVDYDNGSWTYDPLKFWSSDKVSFFAYWPYTAGVTNASAVAGAMPQVEFTQKMDAENMVDFIASHAINLTRDDGVVTLDFKHVLTRLNFKARLDEKLKDNSSTHIFIKEMKICGTDGSTTAAGGTKGNDASRFFSKATFVLGDGKGTPDPTDQTGKKYLNDAEGQWKYEAETSPVINKAEASATAMDLKKLMPIATTTLHSDDKTKDITGVELKQNGDTIGLFKPTAEKKQHYLFLIPPHGIEGIKSNTDVIVELKYEIATADPSLIPEKFTPADERTVAVSLPNGTLQQGKAYNIVFTVGLDPVKVEANVTDWDTDLIENAPEDKAENNDATGILAAWTRLNATKAQDETANYFVIKVDKKPTGNLDLRTTVSVDQTELNAFKLGDQVELLFNDDTDGSYEIAKKVLVPNGWYCEDRDVNGVKRHIITKVTNYITKKAATTNAAGIAAALTDLNTEKGNHKDSHYYAVNVYDDAPASIDLLNVGTAPVLTNFEDGDYIYIYFNSDAGGDKDYKAPANWEIVKVETTPLGKYRLQKKTSSQTSNVAIGNTGFVAGSTINVNK